MDFILITGVSTGIGYSLAKKFHAEGYAVIGSVRSVKDAEKLVLDFGQNFHPLVFDVTDEEAIAAAVLEVERLLKGGVLAGLINNSGIAVGGPVMHLPLSEFRRQFDVNVFGLIAVTKAFLPMLGARPEFHGRAGKIINISSVSGKVGFPFIAPYCASKFALEGFSQSLRRELLLYGIDVISIGPGPVKTPIWGKTEETPEEVLRSVYGPSISRFREFMKKSAEAGLDPDDLANRIFRVFQKKNPRTNYLFMNKKFFNYIVPEYFMTSRMMDNMLKKMLFR
ncbi:MAG: SDR family oxidoreductase [Cyclobacteriaceae bacterium]|nr:SDR family oxidoreductase [Cyclobacteriaceae bacterium]